MCVSSSVKKHFSLGRHRRIQIMQLLKIFYAVTEEKAKYWLLFINPQMAYSQATPEILSPPLAVVVIQKGQIHHHHHPRKPEPFLLPPLCKRETTESTELSGIRVSRAQPSVVLRLNGDLSFENASAYSPKGSQIKFYSIFTVFSHIFFIMIWFWVLECACSAWVALNSF